MPDNVINRFSSVATDPLRSFRFIAEFLPPQQGSKVSDKITGFKGGFTQISGLGINTSSIAYREGGYNTTIHQIPGMTTFNPISFNRGVIYGNAQSIDWMRYLFAAAAGDGLALEAGQDFRCDIKIYVLDHPAAANATATTGGEGGANTPKLGFHVHNAWISTLNYSDMDAGGNNLMVETMGIVHEGLSVFFTDDKFQKVVSPTQPQF
jgi:phage tail-like protein